MFLLLTMIAIFFINTFYAVMSCKKLITENCQTTFNKPHYYIIYYYFRRNSIELQYMGSRNLTFLQHILCRY